MANRVLLATLLAAAASGFGVAYGDTASGLVASYNFNNNVTDGSGRERRNPGRGFCRDDAGRTAPSGTYFIRILAGSQEMSRRVVRIR
jgi:hypothetical protein